jgi:ATP-dependent helicase/DNAse subunit B
MTEWISGHVETGSEPILVVPRAEDAERFRRELSDSSAVGAEVLTFNALFSLVARALDAQPPQELTAPQRLALMRRAAATGGLRGGLAVSAHRAGFAPELDRLIDELQAANSDPATAAAEAAGNPQLEDIASLFAAYVGERDRRGRGDAHLTAAMAIAALNRYPAAWRGRPVGFYGFDDMTGEQIELVRVLSAAAPVLAAVTYEDREALGERARLREELRACGIEGEEELDPDPEFTESETLRSLDRGLFDEDWEAPEPANDGGLVMLEAAGRRNQAEQIAIKIARLLREEEVPAGDVVVALRSPEGDGPLLASVLATHGIPAALQARIPVTATATGRALACLLRASAPTGTAAELLGFLRGPGIAHTGTVDAIELKLRRDGVIDAAEALEELRERRRDGHELHALDVLSAAAANPAEAREELVRIARRLAEPAGRRDGPRDDRAALELSAAGAVAEAVEDLAELDLLQSFCADALAAIEGLKVPATRGSMAGRVVITGPYEIRARSILPYLFVASLQEGEFPSRDSGNPLVPDSERGEIGLPERARHEAEERYVFYAAASRPSRRLYISWRSSEEDGAAASPSPFLDDVARAVGGLPEPLRRELDVVAPAVDEATTPAELGRALAAAVGAAAPSAAVRVVAPQPFDSEALAARLALAGRRNEKPGPLANPKVLSQLAERMLFGASTLEEWLSCPYKWFVGHELSPAPLGEKPEPLAQGGLLHMVLERLYRDPPTEGSLPTVETLPLWIERAAEITEAAAGEYGMSVKRPATRAMLARVDALIAGFLAREAEGAGERSLHPALFEASFGHDEDGSKPPLELGGFELRGSIDRIDLVEGGAYGAIFDYKTGSKVAIGKHLLDAEAITEHGKLQPGLYALAMRVLWGAEPIAALYHPMAATGKKEPRGLLRKEQMEVLGGLGIAEGSYDWIDDEAFDAALEAAKATAQEIVAEMRAGRIRRDPLRGDCGYCEYASVCRIERAARIEDEEDEEDAAA